VFGIGGAELMLFIEFIDDTLVMYIKVNFIVLWMFGSWLMIWVVQLNTINKPLKTHSTHE